MPADFQVMRSISESPEGDVEVIALSGDLDMATVDSLLDVLGAVEGDRSLIVDLAQLEFMDSTGLRAILRANESGSRIALVVAPGSQVARILEIAGIGELVDLFADRDSAIEKLRG
jgi:anti-anti-sigma factor